MHSSLKAWKGNLQDTVAGLVWAARQCGDRGHVLPGILLLYRDRDGELVARFAYHATIADPPSKFVCDRKYVFVLVEMSAASERPEIPHAGLVVIDCEEDTYTVFNPHGVQAHVRDYPGSDNAIDVWVDGFWGTSDIMTRYTTPHLCPSVQGDDPYCLLWCIWWIQQTCDGNNNDATLAEVERLCDEIAHVRDADWETLDRLCATP